MPRFCIAITYGLEAAVPEAEELPPRIPIRVGSLYGFVYIRIFLLFSEPNYKAWF
jgi:hypothetical protein